MIKPYIAKLVSFQNLTVAEAEAAMEIIMTGQATQAQIGAYLMALRMKGETVDEIVGSAKAMRSVAGHVNVKLKEDEILIDIVGTGGDGANSFNISTTSAFIIAGANKKVAKHGNRAASSKCGSADVLAALGVKIDLSSEQVAKCIENIGIGFMFAPVFHPAMKYAIGPRREVGLRTIFNLLGPLTNPAGATHQLVGVYDPSLTETIAKVLGSLGGQAAYVVHGHGGLDELTTDGRNLMSYLHDGIVDTFEFDARKLGLRPAKTEYIKGGEPLENADILRDILSGKDESPRRDVVLLNSAAALATENGDLAAGLALAEKSLTSGAALNKLESLIEYSQKVSLS